MKNKKRKYEIYLYGYPIKEYLPILFFFSVIGAICIILSAIGPNNLLARASAIYLLILAFSHHYEYTSDLQSKDREIANLKQEVRKLETIRECNEATIELLNKELENQ